MEEDCDAWTYFKALGAENAEGQTFEAKLFSLGIGLKDSYKDRSPVRSYESFSVKAGE